MSHSYKFDETRLASAIAATFRRRDTEMPAATPDGLTPEFANDPNKVRQWNAFAADIDTEQVPPLGTIVTEIATFLMPHVKRANSL